MTQPASPESVLAPFDGVELGHAGRTIWLERRGDEFWVDMVDPLWDVEHRGETRTAEGPLPRLRERVVMTTGSHHLQAYWMRRPNSNGVYYLFPMIFDIEAERWIPSLDSFLRPPQPWPVDMQTWNTSCTDCHTVATAPRIRPDEGTVFSKTAELGIACEACHGPGGEHVRAHRSPWRRYLRHLGGDDDATIVNPAKLAPKRSADVCGQCHSFFSEHDPEAWAERGPVFRPGDDLAASKLVFRHGQLPDSDEFKAWAAANPDLLTGRFWADGTIRVAGREFNGLIETACYQRGAMTCLSCHSMHGYADRNDQLRADESVDASCLSCHEDLRGRVAEHTHHAPGSSGQSCQNCHMPHTTYGLFTAMRSHRIDSPSASVAKTTGRPNACNLCHVDRTLAWTAERLTGWYGHAPIETTADEREIAQAVLWALRGDAVQRAIAAFALSWGPALEASGRGWQAPFVARLLIDPYSAVREVAHRSLRRLPGFADYRYDYLAPEQVRFDRSLDALRIWMRGRPERLDRRDPRVLVDANGQLMMPVIDRLAAERDDRPVSIVE
jgi:predicted CXXCH cytochrome family protein